MKKEISPRKELGYEMPTRVIFGRGTLREITDYLPVNGKHKVLLVAGGHFRKSRIYAKLLTDLNSDNRQVLLYDSELKKSDFETVNALAVFCRQVEPDVIVAIGGGTVLDTAKCAAILANNGGAAEDYLITNTKKIEQKGLPFVAVPTTSGTGSEVTPWAVIWDTVGKEKYSLASLLMFPDLAVVDPSLTEGLPPKITAETGMDALVQAIEAYWSRFHNPISDEYALKAISLIINSIETAVGHPDQQAREAMAWGSLFAGLAFSNTKTTICHSVSYPITAHFDVAHGQAVAITLPLFIVYSSLALGERERSLLEALGSETADEAAKMIENLMKNIGLATRLSELGIKEADLDLIVEKGFNPDRVNNAPRVPSAQELKLMLRKIL